jgi:uncharacterized protein YeaO (DUF488 family)
VVILKRAYEPAARDDGWRVLVERLWPRGVAKARLALDEWLKELAPSTELRQWFGHDPERWTEFTRRYRGELRQPAAAALVRELRERARTGRVTLVYAAADTEHNSAIVLRALLERARPPSRAPARRQPK